MGLAATFDVVGGGPECAVCNLENRTPNSKQLTTIDRTDVFIFLAYNNGNRQETT